MNAHTRTGGTGRKSDAKYIAPLCDKHHREYDDGGHETFGAKYDLVMATVAEQTNERWLSRGDFPELDY